MSQYSPINKGPLSSFEEESLVDFAQHSTIQSISLDRLDLLQTANVSETKGSSSSPPGTKPTWWKGHLKWPSRWQRRTLHVLMFIQAESLNVLFGGLKRQWRALLGNLLDRGGKGSAQRIDVVEALSRLAAQIVPCSRVQTRPMCSAST